MPSNTDAHRLAADAHAGQTDKAGAPYIRHVNRVAGASARRAEHAITRDGLGLVHDDILQAAYLHDVIEDTATTADDLRAAGYAPTVVAMVERLTKSDEHLTYAERIDALIASGDLGAILIKLSDNEDNANAERALPHGSALSARYAASMPRLREAASALGYTGP